MKTGARDNSAAVRVGVCVFFHRRIHRGGKKVDRWTTETIGFVRAGDVLRSAKMRGRGARGTRGDDTLRRTRRRARGRVETVFEEGRGRSRARGLCSGRNARRLRAPPACSKKYLAVPTCRARSGKMTPDARSKREWDGETSPTRPSTGRFREPYRGTHL
jgi:hypothetical protein